MRRLLMLAMLALACGAEPVPEPEAEQADAGPGSVDAGRFCFPVVQHVCKPVEDGGYECHWESRPCPH